ncbi:hypothetical protein [Streptomyces showdoensis]|uniref:Uncharacterized protein n=1 Tax=Streptomyces showdoensis TaxID=68268 RepID=A0A2P2GLA3_STREW|nr:hypothetical protein [Streptomyces showdoensis]KKZ72291.1 hypothetical protein VO63_19115 [Streptomyces showdoensis]
MGRYVEGAPDDLPDVIARIHARGLATSEADGPLRPSEPSIWFAYRRPEGTLFGLYLVSGSVHVPRTGETVLLGEIREPLRVVDVQTRYSTNPLDGIPLAAVTVCVEPTG